MAICPPGQPGRDVIAVPRADTGTGASRRRVEGNEPGRRIPGHVGDATRDRGLLLKGVLDFFASVFEVAFGLIALAFSFEGLIIRRFAEVLLNFAPAGRRPRGRTGRSVACQCVSVGHAAAATCPAR
jgi:hypothetical protein